MRTLENNRELLNSPPARLTGPLAEAMKIVAQVPLGFKVTPELRESLGHLTLPMNSKPFGESLDRFQRSISDLREYIRTQSKISGSPLSNLAGAIQSLSERTTLTGIDFAGVLASSAFRSDELRILMDSKFAPIGALGAGSLKIPQFESFEKLLDGFKGSFFAKVAEEARWAVESDGTSDFSEFETLVTEIVKDPNQSGATQIEVITLILAILMAVLAIDARLLQQKNIQLQEQQISDSKKGEKVQLENADKLLKLLEELGSEIRQSNGTDIIYFVSRHAELKSHPKFRSRTIGILIVGTTVRILPPEGDVLKYHRWLLVEAVDPETGLPQYGWVSKKYLKRVDKVGSR